MDDIKTDDMKADNKVPLKKSDENTPMSNKKITPRNNSDRKLSSYRSTEVLENELNKVNLEIREIRAMSLPWEDRFDMLADHVKSCMNH